MKLALFVKIHPFVCLDRGDNEFHVKKHRFIDMLCALFSEGQASEEGQMGSTYDMLVKSNKWIAIFICIIIFFLLQTAYSY